MSTLVLSEEEKNPHEERKHNISIDINYDDPIQWNIQLTSFTDDIQWAKGAKNHEELYAMYLEHIIDTRLEKLGLPKISKIIEEYYPEMGI